MKDANLFFWSVIGAGFVTSIILFAYFYGETHGLSMVQTIERAKEALNL